MLVERDYRSVELYHRSEYAEWKRRQNEVWGARSSTERALVDAIHIYKLVDLAASRRQMTKLASQYCSGRFVGCNMRERMYDATLAHPLEVMAALGVSPPENLADLMAQREAAVLACRYIKAALPAFVFSWPPTDAIP